MSRRLFSVLYMFLMTLALTSLVSGIKSATERKIHTNEKVKLQRIILNVLNIPVIEDAAGDEIVRIFQDRVETTDLEDGAVYIGYREDRRIPQGYAFPVGGAGFWGPISGMVGISADASEILGIAFYKHSETPGLGARITEDWFREQFVGLPIFPLVGEKKIFYLKPPGTTKATNELDAITGATGTSRGVEAFLNRDLDLFLREKWPLLSKR